MRLDLRATTGVGQISRQRWQQLGTSVRIREFPEPTTLQAIADALPIDVTRVLLAAARSIGLDVRPGRADLAGLLPAGTENLNPEQRDAVLHVIRAMLNAQRTADELADVVTAAKRRRGSGRSTHAS